MLLTAHNLRFYQDLMGDLLAAIEAGQLADQVARFHADQGRGDVAPWVPGGS